MGPTVSDIVVLLLVIGLIVSGIFLIHSMQVTRSLVRVRIAGVVSLVLMILLIAFVATR
jgi:hypothetical protein